MRADSTRRKLHKFIPVISGFLFAARPELLLVVKYCLTRMVPARVLFIFFHQEIFINTTWVSAYKSLPVSCHHYFFFLARFLKLFSCFFLLLFAIKVYSCFMNYLALSSRSIFYCIAFPKT